MKTLKLIPAVILSLILFSCSGTEKIIIPLTDHAIIEDAYTIIWNGSSQAFRYTDNNWVRDEKYDYVFDVVQKRYKNQWKSVKNMHRLHTAYDGKAGNRDQTMYFELAYKAIKGTQVISDIHSSLGEGNGTSDEEFREQTFVINMNDTGMFVTYNKIKITQHYNYEEGVLTETVELLKEKDGVMTPFMKNEEKAYFYLKGKINHAPTQFEMVSK
jgi:hypothetical protein